MWIPLLLAAAATTYAYTTSNKSVAPVDYSESNDAIDKLSATIAELKTKLSLIEGQSTADSATISSLEQSIIDLETQLSNAISVSEDDGITQDDVDYVNNLLNIANEARESLDLEVSSLTESNTEISAERDNFETSFNTLTNEYEALDEAKGFVDAELAESVLTNATTLSERDVALSSLYGDDMLDDGFGGLIEERNDALAADLLTPFGQSDIDSEVELAESSFDLERSAFNTTIDGLNTSVTDMTAQRDSALDADLLTPFGQSDIDSEVELAESSFDLERSAFNTTIDGLNTSVTDMTNSRDAALTTLYGDDMTADGLGGFEQTNNDYLTSLYGADKISFEDGGDGLGGLEGDLFLSEQNLSASESAKEIIEEENEDLNSFISENNYQAEYANHLSKGV